MTILEVCVDTPEGLEAAITGGADRIELCAALDVGGLTPSAGLMALAARSPVPVHALIRPRPGDFVCSDADMACILDDIAQCRRAGLAGVVIGASLPDGRLDRAGLARMIAGAQGLTLTLHRAFDLTPDMDEALETATQLGFQRILTSGGAPAAPEGLEALARLSARAAGRIIIMPGAGIRPETAPPILARLRPTEIHASCSVPVTAVAPEVQRLGFDSPARRVTDPATVAALKGMLAGQ